DDGSEGGPGWRGPERRRPEGLLREPGPGPRAERVQERDQQGGGQGGGPGAGGSDPQGAEAPAQGPRPVPVVPADDLGSGADHHGVLDGGQAERLAPV